VKHDGRLNRLKQQLDPEPARMVFHMCHETCEAYKAMSSAEHQAWHRARGDLVMTMNLGDAIIRDPADEP
jgi:hypothetical protein